MTVRAKIAAVLGPHEAAINAGSAKGVSEGDIARVVKRTEITDPDTRQPLGEVTTEIVTMRVRAVTEAFCIANTLEPSGAADIFGLLRTGRQSQPDPVQRIGERADTLDPGIIVVRVGSDVDIVKPTPTKSPA